MSFFCSFPYEDRIELLTDRANYLPDGTLILNASKVFTSPHCPMAITARGNTALVRKFATACLGFAEAGSFYQAAIDLEQAFDAWRAEGSEYGGHPFQMFVAGWSPELGFSQFAVSSVPDCPMQGVEPMRVNTFIGSYYAGPPITEDETAPILTPDRVKNGAADFGPEFCQHLRGKTDFVVDDPEQRQIHMVGGGIDHTIVTTEGVSTRRLMTWPDKPFEPIDPALEPMIWPALASPDTATPVGLMAAAA